ncbi:hypothetical protein C4K88_00165 [Arthrobacter pityocampae]|uniref:Uncharacterized protein n=1 Tax=Arthrobacter pityocampae TaxID=547334 RepID=A0A2S5J0L1_9MICC|nr:hypothetical protein [Arthrobacter pityocampae]PPB50372.1 hypothetical protein C4K88_00165 [Arthrobacter pityocampae]
MTYTPTSRAPFLRTWLIWVAGFLAFPLAGLIGTLVIGRVDDPIAALTGGAITGLVLGTGQTLTSSHRLRASRWIPATTVGLSAGLLVGTSAVDYRTSLADLALMGALNGLVVGACQAAALPPGGRRRWVWTPIASILWALGWTVTTLLMVSVDEQFIVFGASGALVFAALSGLALYWLVPARTDADTPAEFPTTTAATP